MNSKYTPGPWAIWTSNSYRRIGSEATGREIVYPVNQGDGHPDILFRNGGEDGPDARLIAAAPDLLEALLAIIGLMSQALNTDTDTEGMTVEGEFVKSERLRAAYLRADRAIAKAGAA